VENPPVSADIPSCDECYEHTYGLSFSLRTKSSKEQVTQEEVLEALQREVDRMEAMEWDQFRQAVTLVESHIVFE
jgi:hypothetical protein